MSRWLTTRAVAELTVLRSACAQESSVAKLRCDQDLPGISCLHVLMKEAGADDPGCGT